MEEHKNKLAQSKSKNQGSPGLGIQRQISANSHSSYQDIFFETEEEVDEVLSPLILMNQQASSSLVSGSREKNPLIANKGSAVNGRILTEEDASYRVSFNSMIQFKASTGSGIVEDIQTPARSSSLKKRGARKFSKKQISNMALQDDLLPNIPDQSDPIFQSLKYQNQESQPLDTIINRSELKNEISEQNRLQLILKQATKDNTNQSTVKNKESNKYILNAIGSGEITLNPKRRQQSFEDILQANSEGDVINSSRSEDIYLPEGEDQVEEVKDEDEKNYEKEMNQLFKIETKFFFRQSSNNLRLSQNFLTHSQDKELLRTETADFPMKLLTHAMLDPIINSSLNQIEDNTSPQANGDRNTPNQQLKQSGNGGGGTPRFPTDEEIGQQELKMLLTFAFKDQDELDKFSKEMTFIINQDPIIERPSEQKIKQIRSDIKRDPPNNKKTLVFTSIDGLFMFSSQAQIVKTCDKIIKMRQDGVKRAIKIFYRPHMHTFIKTLSKYFELVIYLKEDHTITKQWLEVLNSALDSSQPAPQNKKNLKLLSKQQQQQQQQVPQQPKHFEIVLCKDQCIIDKPMRVVCRNKDLLLEGRQLKNILFVTNDIRDMTLIHQNSIYVRSYHGNKYENTLAKLKVYLLKHILECNDVRDVVKRDFLSHTKQHQMKLLKKLSLENQAALQQQEQLMKSQADNSRMPNITVDQVYMQEESKSHGQIVNSNSDEILNAKHRTHREAQHEKMKSENFKKTNYLVAMQESINLNFNGTQKLSNDIKNNSSLLDPNCLAKLEKMSNKQSVKSNNSSGGRKSRKSSKARLSKNLGEKIELGVELNNQFNQTTPAQLNESPKNNQQSIQMRKKQ